MPGSDTKWLSLKGFSKCAQPRWDGVQCHNVAPRQSDPAIPGPGPGQPRQRVVIRRGLEGDGGEVATVVIPKRGRNKSKLPPEGFGPLNLWQR